MLDFKSDFNVIPENLDSIFNDNLLLDDLIIPDLEDIIIIRQPDLVVTSVDTGNAFVSDDTLKLPLEVVVQNQGNAPADLFKIDVQYTNDGNPPFVAAFTADDTADVNPDDLWYPFTRNPLAAEDEVTFTGELTLDDSLLGEPISLVVTADSNAGDEFIPELGRVEESNEDNNRSDDVELTLDPTEDDDNDNDNDNEDNNDNEPPIEQPELDPTIERALSTGDWIEALEPVVQNAIETASEAAATGELIREISRWVVAGQTSSESLNELLVELDLEPAEDLSDIFQLPGVQVNSIKAEAIQDSPFVSEFLQEQGITLWAEYVEEIEGTATLDPDTITEPAFDLDNAPDLNRDGTPDGLWHLFPTDNTTGDYGTNTTGAWDTSTGEGVYIAIKDSPFDLNHPDLQSQLPTNFDIDGDGVNDAVDTNSNGIPDIFESEGVTYPGGDPRWPSVPGRDGADQSHGTAVSGIALADDDGNNALGIAPDAFWIPDSGFNTNYSNVTRSLADVINNSWGWNNLQTLRLPNPTSFQQWVNASDNAMVVRSSTNNRDGVWGNTSDDPFAAYRSSFWVGAAMANGDIEDYSTPGANVFVNAPVNGDNVRWSDWFASGGGPTLNTVTSDVTDAAGDNTDNRGYADGNLTETFNGTSAAAPMVSGTIALMLEANPALEVRDIQHIFVETSQKNRLTDTDGDGVLDASTGGTVELRNTFTSNVDTDGDNAIDPYNTGWFMNAAGNWVSDSFGFGMIDADAAVDLASTWTAVDPELKATTDEILTSPFTIPEGTLGDLNSLQAAGSWDVASNLNTEWVELTLDLNTTEQDELIVSLVSPSGTRSVLMAPGGFDNTSFNTTRTFTTNQFWGESSQGEWTVEVLDVNGDGDAQTIANAHLDIYGTCTEESPLEVNPFSDLSANGITAEELAQEFLWLGGAGENTIDYDLNNVVEIGDRSSFGTFSNGNPSNLLVDNGLIFTSGQAIDAIGPNKKPNTTTSQGTPGHRLLDDLVSDTTYDASGLEITFTPLTDLTLSWDYQFGSEEFQEWAGSVYNDSAGIFLIELQNPDLPLDPDNGEVVNLTSSGLGDGLTINSYVNNGIDIEDGLEEVGFINHICGDLGWEYDGGSSTPWQTPSITLNAGQTYAIAVLTGDTGDRIYDSGLIVGGPGSVSEDDSDFDPPELIPDPGDDILFDSGFDILNRDDFLLGLSPNTEIDPLDLSQSSIFAELSFNDSSTVSNQETLTTSGEIGSSILSENRLLSLI